MAVTVLLLYRQRLAKNLHRPALIPETRHLPMQAVRHSGSVLETIQPSEGLL
ncbi:hypothetical protein D3C87_2142200 [compost metagenome]